jgi:acyl-CoA thioesterase YciA
MPDPDERRLAIQLILMPKDTNAHGTIFGGVILSQIDLAGAVEARRHTRNVFATVAMREVKFHHPVYVGDLVSFYTRLLRIGTTSIAVKVEVEARRKEDDSVVKVTEAEVVYVCVDGEGRKIPVRPMTA